MGYREGARVYNDANISIGNGAYTNLTFNSERYDTDGIHDVGSNTERLTCQTAGKYMITGSIRWESNSTGVRYVLVELNGSTTIVQQAKGAYTDVMFMSVTTAYDLEVGDYVTLKVFQNSGGSKNIQAIGNYAPEFSMQRIG